MGEALLVATASDSGTAIAALCRDVAAPDGDVSHGPVKAASDSRAARAAICFDICGAFNRDPVDTAAGTAADASSVGSASSDYFAAFEDDVSGDPIGDELVVSANAGGHAARSCCCADGSRMFGIGRGEHKLGLRSFLLDRGARKIARQFCLGVCLADDVDGSARVFNLYRRACLARIGRDAGIDVEAVGKVESDVSRFDVNPCCAAGAIKAVRARLVDGNGGVGAFARDVNRGYNVIGKSGRCGKDEPQGAERSECERARKMVAQGVKHAG